MTEATKTPQSLRFVYRNLTTLEDVNELKRAIKSDLDERLISPDRARMLWSVCKKVRARLMSESKAE